MPCFVEDILRLITGSGLPLRRQWWRHPHFLDWVNPYGPRVVRWNYYIHIYFWSSQGLYCFILIPSLLFTYSTLYFVLSAYCSSFLFLLTNALLSYLMAVFPSSLMHLFPSSVHLANTQQVLQLNSQHSASYHAGSGFEIVRPLWTISSSSSLPSVECRNLPFEQATLISSQSSMHVHPQISAIISAALYSVVRPYSMAYPGILFGGGVQQIHLRTEEREREWGSGGGVLEAAVIWYKKFHFI